MAMHRRNTTKHVGSLSEEQPWFKANKQRQRNRRDMAKASKRKNRSKK